jgi:hypothetical protein
MAAVHLPVMPNRRIDRMISLAGWPTALGHGPALLAALYSSEDLGRCLAAFSASMRKFAANSSAVSFLADGGGTFSR